MLSVFWRTYISASTFSSVRVMKKREWNVFFSILTIVSNSLFLLRICDKKKGRYFSGTD